MDTPDERTVIAAIGPVDAYYNSVSPDDPQVDDEVSEWSLRPYGKEGWFHGQITLEKNGETYPMYQVRLGPAPEFTVDLDADQELLEALNPDIDFSGEVPVAKNVVETSAPPPTCLDGPAEHPQVEAERNEITAEEIAQRLPEDSAERKNYPIITGVLDYFPDALAELSRLAKYGNDKHNPGEPLHWAREKSDDHINCIGRHMVDRGTKDGDFYHDVMMAWRALANLQLLMEKEKGLPPSRGSR